MDVHAGDAGFVQSLFQRAPRIVQHFVSRTAARAQQFDNLVKWHFAQFAENRRTLFRRWLLDEPTTDVIIPGGKSLKDYRQAIRATKLPPLTPVEKANIEHLKESLQNRYN